MPKYGYLVLTLLFLGLISSIYVSEAVAEEENLKFAQGGYKKVYPLDVSPLPDIIQDREWLEKPKIEAEKQKRLLGAEEKLMPVREKPMLVGKEPSEIVYQISVNDKLYISVWRVPDLSMEFIVGPDGKISFPLIGNIDASGRSLSELDAEITEKLKEYVLDPQVSVMVKEFAGDRLIVLGEVKSPGVYKFVGRTNIMDVIALAGGFTDRAKSSHIVIVRDPRYAEKDTNLISVPIKSILKGNVKKNIDVKPNDIVYVSRTAVSNLNEFYDEWVTPALGTVISFETMRSLRRTRLGKTP